MTIPTKTKLCRICKDTFLPKCPSQIICDKEHHTTCPVCGKDVIWNSTRPVPACSPECRKKLTVLHNIEKYGCEYPIQNKQVRDKRNNTMLDRYGTTIPLQNDKIKDKTIQTNRERFGVDWGLGNNVVRGKVQSTMTERYGNPTTLQCEELKEKVYNSMRLKYKTTVPINIPEIKHKIQDTCMRNYGVFNPMCNTEVANRSGKNRQSIKYSGEDNDTYIWNCNSNPSVKQIIRTDSLYSQRGSIPESTLCRRVEEHIRSHNLSCITNYTIDNLTYNYFFPYNKMTLCVHPNTYECTKESEYLDMTYSSTQAGYRCIHIFEWDDLDKLMDMFCPTQPIYARNCEIYKITPKVGDEFLSNYHLQGTCRNQLLYLGLVCQGELYQVMTFGNSRYDTAYDIELLRLCTKSGYRVIGGASKLFSYAVHDYNLNNIISYCDASKFSGDVYLDMGMTFIRHTPPQEIWSRCGRKITANLLRQRGYDQLFGTNYGKGVSNNMLMLRYGWTPVYDCGQYVFQYRAE